MKCPHCRKDIEAIKIAIAELKDAQGEWESVTETYAPEWTHLIKSSISQLESTLAKRRIL